MAQRRKVSKIIHARVYPFTHEKIEMIKYKIKEDTGFDATITEIIETAINLLSSLDTKKILSELKAFKNTVGDNLLKRNKK